MKFRIRSTLLALSTGVIALSTGACLARLFGDILGDQIFLGGIQ